MLRHSIKKHTLIFKRPGGTSRGVLKTKACWFLSIWYDENPSKFGIGECSIISRLSPDNPLQIEGVLENLTWDGQTLSRKSQLSVQEFPAVQFAIETALYDLNQAKEHVLFPSLFTKNEKGIPINGLIWMGDLDFMKTQISKKLNDGYRCLKLKIGSLTFETELNLLRQIRNEFSAQDLELRVDANGAFQIDSALENLKRLSEFGLHSIEQPIPPGQIDNMTNLCANSPLDIALDEELIGVFKKEKQIDLIQTIKPQYIILKPSLLGGLKSAESWIEIAKNNNVGWWATSALESNIGLNAIAQWVATLNTKMYQGLGTGQLFTNNIDSPLYLEKDVLRYDSNKIWGKIPK